MSVSRKTLTPLSTARMLQALHLTPHSLDDLVAISGLSKPVVRRYVRELHTAQMVHVGDWGRDRRGYPTIRKFSAGSQPDAPCPLSTRTAADRMRDLRAARKEDVCAQS